MQNTYYLQNVALHDVLRCDIVIEMIDIALMLCKFLKPILTLRDIAGQIAKAISTML